MTRVRAGEIFYPEHEHVEAPPLCLTPPSKSVLVGKIQDAAVHLNEGGQDVSKVEELLVLLLGEKTAATACLVPVLHLVSERDELLATDHVYVGPLKCKALLTLQLVDKADSFLHGLPVLG